MDMDKGKDGRRNRWMVKDEWMDKRIQMGVSIGLMMKGWMDK